MSFRYSTSIRYQILIFVVLIKTMKDYVCLVCLPFPRLTLCMHCLVSSPYCCFSWICIFNFRIGLYLLFWWQAINISRVVLHNSWLWSVLYFHFFTARICQTLLDPNFHSSQNECDSENPLTDNNLLVFRKEVH